MSQISAYGVQSATDNVAPLTINRREVGPTDIQIEILYCGVCHSDIHQARNEWGGSIYPMVPGHEIVGRITHVGTDVKNFTVGQLAGVGCLVDSCQTCPSCAANQEQYCDEGGVGTYNAKDRQGNPTYGGYSTAIVVDQKFTLHIADSLPLKGVAPLLCAGITTYSPLRHWKIGKGHKVLSTSPSKEKDALALGAHHFAITSNADEMKKLAGSFDFILNTISAQHDYNQYLGLLTVNGTMVVVGVPPQPTLVHAFSLIGKRRSLAGSLIGGIKETQEMLDYCAEHNIVSDVEVINADYINEAYTRMMKADVKYRFVIDVASIK
jgi:alcohol dehydrogenase (NADP+)